jgi:hypothetical protein
MDDVFFTSKGPRNASQIRQVEGGSRVRQTSLGWEMRTMEAETWTSIDQKLPATYIVAVTGGWQSRSRWTSRTSRPIVSFEAQWTVPVAPTATNGQTIYLFNGLHATGNRIVQRARQGGPSLPGAARTPGAWRASGWGGQLRTKAKLNLAELWTTIAARRTRGRT